MIKEDLIMAICNDISGQNRGKCFPAKEREKRFKNGVGWVPTNTLITCFNSIADSIYGSVDDLILKPDDAAEVEVDFEDGSPKEHFVIGDILQLDGTPWECCTRSLAKKSLERFFQETGLSFFSTFEQEFFFSGVDPQNWHGFGTGSYRQGAAFAETFCSALRKAGLQPDSFLAEWGPAQFEATLSPTVGIKSADNCVIFRELARATASKLNERVSFAPIVPPGIAGNGVHIHFSLLDKDHKPVCFDPSQPMEMSKMASQFCAGILKYMPAMTVFFAASASSYERLVPHRWSAAYNNLAVRDREAGLRICPINNNSESSAASQFNIEYRAADATASPYLQLAALVNAGLQGIIDDLDIPLPTTGDLSQMSEEKLKTMNVVRLPTSLGDALEKMYSEPVFRNWFPGNFIDVYFKHKSCEYDYVKDLDHNEICERYAYLY